MANPMYPAAVWYPGINAGYQAGRNDMRAVVCHYTVGYNSLDLLARQGTCQFLVSRDGTVWQLAEVDAECWHAGAPFNGLGPGIEVEYYDEPTMFTPAQLAACGDLVVWLSWEWGLPLVYYDTGGDNAARVSDWHGFLSHRACRQTSGDWHYDYWSLEDWEAMIGGGGPRPGEPSTTYGRRRKVDFVEFKLGDHYDTFRVDGDGTVIHSFYPWQRGVGDITVGTEIVGRGVKPNGNIGATHDGTRYDLWVEGRDGELVHFFQHGGTDFAWYEDGARW